MTDSELTTPEGRAEAIDARRWLLLREADGVHALPAEAVLTISELRAPTRLPDAPDCILGVINHRGVPVTVVGLGALLGRSGTAGEEDPRLVLVRRGAHPIALAAADVLGFTESLTFEASNGPRIIDLDDLLQDIF